MDKLEQTVENVEKMLGSSRGLRARESFARRLDEVEGRVDRLEQQLKDLDKRVRRVESRP